MTKVHGPSFPKGLTCPVRPLSAHTNLHAPQPGPSPPPSPPLPACELPHEWCRSPGAVLKRADCDDDGVADWVCIDPTGPDPTTAAGGGAAASGGAGGAGGGAGGVRSVTNVSLSGDVGVGRRGAITSGKGCDPAASGWPSAPKKLCPEVFGGGVGAGAVGGAGRRRGWVGRAGQSCR